MIGALTAGLFLPPAYYVAKAKGYNIALPLVAIGIFSAGIPIMIDVINHPDVDLFHPLSVWGMTLPVVVWCIVWLLPMRKDAPGEEYLGITFECPECKEEVTFLRGMEGLAKLCPECGEIIIIPTDQFSSEPSIPERIKPDIPSGQVCYASFGDEMLAAQMQALFEDNGIQSEIIDGTGGGSLPQLSGTQGFKLIIDVDDWDIAVEIETNANQGMDFTGETPVD